MRRTYDGIHCNLKHLPAHAPVRNAATHCTGVALGGLIVFLGVHSNSTNTRAASGSVRVGSGAGGTRVESATSAFTEAMLMRRAAGPAASGLADSTLADVIARYSVNIPSLQPRLQKQQQQQQQLSPVSGLPLVAGGAAAGPGDPALTRTPLAVRVSWALPPPGLPIIAEPVSPSTVASFGGSWRERDARRSGDSSSSGEYPGRYIRSLPMLLSAGVVTESSFGSAETQLKDPAGTVSGYLDSIRQHVGGGAAPPPPAAEGPAQGFGGAAGVREQPASVSGSEAALPALGGADQDERPRFRSASSSIRLCAPSSYD